MDRSQHHAPSKTGACQQRVPAWIRFRAHLSDDVSPSFLAELQLVILTFCTGIQGQPWKPRHEPAKLTGVSDATTFSAHHCFVSNQTGNTVFLCMALILPQLNGDMFITSNIGMALGVFLGAGWLTGQLSHRIGPRKRWWLILCNLIQASLVLGAAGTEYIHGARREGPLALAVIGLLAFAAGSQVVQSRSLSMPEISTAMATAAWVDLMIDKELFALRNRSRNRRVAFLLSLALGAVVGAAILRRAGSATAIAVSGGGKLLVATMYLFTRAEVAEMQQSAV